MVSQKIVHDQLKQLGFKPHGWGKAEVSELPHILMPDEEIYDLVNGIYEGGFALLVATNVRLLLIDKKPLNYLTVEDLRFDMINELDYSHRLLGATINIASGDKALRFRSYNQPRLRKVINHVQHCMAESKKKQTSHLEDQRIHLEQINQQLQAYLITQHQQQEQLRIQLQTQAAPTAALPEPVKPSPELADYLYAQRLLAEYRAQTGQLPVETLGLTPPVEAETSQVSQATASPESTAATAQLQELYTEGAKEIFGKHAVQQTATPAVGIFPAIAQAASSINPASLEINPFNIARAKLPLALRNRKFGHAMSFHGHNQTVPKRPQAVTQ